jgi:hypothetical protein
MAAQLDSSEVSRFQSWTFEKAMLEAHQPSPSDSTNLDFVHVKSDMVDFKPAMAQPQTPVMLNEEYLSSEEALSPMDGQDDCSDDELSASVCDAQVSHPVKLAVAIYITSVGKAKVVDVPLPSLTNSPSLSNTSSDSDSHKPFQQPLSQPRIESFSLPRRPRTPVKRKAIHINHIDRPILRTKFSAPSTSVASPTSIHTSSPTASTARQPTWTVRTASLMNDSPTRLAVDSFTTASTGSSTKSPQDRLPAGHSRLRNISRKISNFALYGPGGRPPSPDDAPAAASDIPPVPKLRNRAQTQAWVANGAAMRSVPALHATGHGDFDFGLPLSAADGVAPAGPGAPPRSTTVGPPPPTRAAPERPRTRGRMVPRGAAERAPPIVIPPCPEDWDMDSPAREGWIKRRKSVLGFY